MPTTKPRRSPSVDSFDSPSSSDSNDGYLDSDDERELALKEWQESLERVQMLVTVIILPMVGKYLGRKWAYWAFDRYTALGLGKAFWFGVRTSTATLARFFRPVN